MSVTLQTNLPQFDATLTRRAASERTPLSGTGTTVPMAATKDLTSTAVAAANPPSDSRLEEPPKAELDSALIKLRQAIELRAPNELQFSVDKETGKTVISIVDSKTGDVLRQIPPQELIEIAKSIDRMQGLLVHSEA